MGKIYQVKVFGFEGEMKVVDLCETEVALKKITVLQLKGKIAERFSITADDLQLSFAGKRMEGDSDLLSQHGIQHLSVIQLVVRVPGGLAA